MSAVFDFSFAAIAELARADAARALAEDVGGGDLTAAARALIESLVTTADPRDREIEAERARARTAVRFGAHG